MSRDFPIVDAHQHFWEPDVNYHPWLRDEPPIAFRYGDYAALKRRYLPADYFADARRWNVVRTVYVEAEWDPLDPVGEMRYVERLRRETGWPSVAVAQAWLDREDCARLLEQQAAFAFVRSVRHKPAAGQMDDARWRVGFARLARHGLRFELQAPWTQLDEAARLARDFPDTRIILNHTGLPADRSRAGLDGWRRALGALAACPNAALKVSGLGRPGRPWTVEANREIVLAALGLFGIERSMFASNFPVDGLCAGFDDIVLGCREILRGLAPHEQRQFFHDNALRIYAME